MPQSYTVEEITRQLSRAHYRIRFDDFAIYILRRIPCYDDVWQIEKWEVFKAACASISRLPEEYLQRILDYDHKENP